jgi:hypothetical protein
LIAGALALSAAAFVPSTSALAADIPAAPPQMQGEFQPPPPAYYPPPPVVYAPPPPPPVYYAGAVPPYAVWPAPYYYGPGYGYGRHWGYGGGHWGRGHR